MPHLDVTINGRSYTLACDPGQEAHLGRLARYVDQKIAGLVKSVGQVGDARLLLLASLIIADELSDTDTALSQERSRTSGKPLPSPDEAFLTRTINGLAARVESLTALLLTDEPE